MNGIMKMKVGLIFFNNLLINNNALNELLFFCELVFIQMIDGFDAKLFDLVLN